MPILVHLAPEKALRSIRKVGIKAHRASGDLSGVFCMPVLRDYSVSYQWLRELRRSGANQFFGVHFRVPDGERVFVGHYGKEKVDTTVGEAIRIMMKQADPRGYELILPRSIGPKELHRVRALKQVVGWRFSPEAKGRKPCACDYCQRGLIKGRRLREPAAQPTPKVELMRRLRAASGEPLCEVLQELSWRSRGKAGELRWLMPHPDAQVVRALAEALRKYRGPEAKRMLRELCALAPRPGWSALDVDEVRREAATSLVERMGRDARAFLGQPAEDPLIREALADYEHELTQA